MNKKYFFAAAIMLVLLAVGLQLAFGDIPVGDINIDIKPYSDDNTINLGSNGVIPVAILGSTDFEATTVFPETISLAGVTVAMRGNGAYKVGNEDVNGDGFMDLVVQIESTNLDLSQVQDGYAVLLCKHEGDTSFHYGADVVRIVPK